MKKLLRVIDSISDWQERLFGSLPTVLLLILVTKVVLRYVFRAPAMPLYESAMMAGGITLAMGWAVATRHNRHIRIDLLYVHMSPRVQAAIDTFGGLFLAIPLILLLAYTSVTNTVESWVIGERSAETSWYPPLAPFRTIVTIAFLTFFLQTVVTFIRDFYKLIRGKAYD